MRRSSAACRRDQVGKEAQRCVYLHTERDAQRRQKLPGLIQHHFSLSLAPPKQSGAGRGNDSSPTVGPSHSAWYSRRKGNSGSPAQQQSCGTCLVTYAHPECPNLQQRPAAPCSWTAPVTPHSQLHPLLFHAVSVRCVWQNCFRCSLKAPFSQHSRSQGFSTLHVLFCVLNALTGPHEQCLALEIR